MVFDYYSGNNKRFAKLSASVMGPSVAVRWKNFNFGIYERFRSHFSSTRLDGEWSYYAFDDRLDETSFNWNGGELAGATFIEWGLNANYTFDHLDGDLTVGANVKYLVPYDGFYFRVNDEIEVTKLADGVRVNSLSADFGYASNVNEESEEYSRSRNGHGFGLDLGVNYIAESPYGKNAKWSVGASLLDLGYLRYNSNAQDYSISNTNSVELNGEEFEDLETTDDLVQDFITAADQLEIEVNQGTDFTLITPTAISIQGNYQFTKRLHVSGVLTRSVPMPGANLNRANSLVVVPRFQSRWLEFMVPISVVEDRSLQVGTSMRLGYITIGTENLAGFTGTSELNGLDAYVAIKVNPFSLGKGKKGNKYNGKGGSCDCPSLNWN